MENRNCFLNAPRIRFSSKVEIFFQFIKDKAFIPYLIVHLLRMLLLKYPNQTPELFGSKMTFTMLMRQQTNKTKQNKKS